MTAGEDETATESKDQLGSKDLFGKELRRITLVMSMTWAIGSFKHLVFISVTEITVTVALGYFGLIFGMANLSDDPFKNFIWSSIAGVLFEKLFVCHHEYNSHPNLKA